MATQAVHREARSRIARERLQRIGFAMLALGSVFGGARAAPLVATPTVQLALSPVATQTSAQGTWEEGAHPILYQVGEYGPYALLALTLFVIARAIVRRNRYRALEVLNEDDQRRVLTSIAEVEKRTVGEIVPVVLERSDRHPGARWLCALCTLLIGSTLLEAHLPWTEPHWLLLCQAGLGAVGFLLAELLPDAKRLFVTDARATEMAEEQALQEFHRLGLHKTRDATGVLIFVSLFERRAIVLGDSGIHSKVGDEHWQSVERAILDGIVRGSLRDGLLAGIQACGDALAKHFPQSADGPNEIENRLIVRRE